MYEAPHFGGLSRIRLFARTLGGCRRSSLGGGRLFSGGAQGSIDDHPDLVFGNGADDSFAIHKKGRG